MIVNFITSYFWQVLVSPST